MSNALIVLDMYNDDSNTSKSISIKVISAVSRTISAFNAAKQPVVFTTMGNLGRDHLIKAVRQHCLNNDQIIKKNWFSPFNQEAFKQFLQQHGVDKIYLCGVETGTDVLKTALDAFEHNYEAVVIADTCYDSSIIQHQQALNIIARTFGPATIVNSPQVIEQMKAQEKPSDNKALH